jgi:hypothetical protein
MAGGYCRACNPVQRRSNAVEPTPHPQRHPWPCLPGSTRACQGLTPAVAVIGAAWWDWHVSPCSTAPRSTGPEQPSALVNQVIIATDCHGGRDEPPLKFTGSFAPQSRVLRPVASPQELEQPGGFGADLPVLIPWLACLPSGLHRQTLRPLAVSRRWQCGPVRRMRTTSASSAGRRSSSRSGSFRVSSVHEDVISSWLQAPSRPRKAEIVMPICIGLHHLRFRQGD